MLREWMSAQVYGLPPAAGVNDARVDERALVARFAAKVNAIASLDQAPPALQSRILDEIKAIAQRLDLSREAGSPSGYGRRVLYENPGRWSLAAISLRLGQHTEQHDHDGWGCAVTVQGIERDRRFAHDDAGNLRLIGEQDYPPGTGYTFDPLDIHQPVGVDPDIVTVALHFLVHGPVI